MTLTNYCTVSTFYQNSRRAIPSFDIAFGLLIKKELELIKRNLKEIFNVLV